VAAPGQPGRPEFVPWAPEPAPVAPAYAPTPGPPVASPVASPQRRPRVWVVVASLLTLVAAALVAGFAATGVSPPSGLASPGLLLVLFVVVVAVIVGGGLAFVAVKGLRAAQARTERERDQAHARAQLLAAALDPDTAMRLLGYDGNGKDGR
ncbi:ATPase, partial [Nonomuraea sp. NPDC005983]